MFDKFRLKEALVKYKEVFETQQWPNEKYKWEAVKCLSRVMCSRDAPLLNP